MNKTLVTMIFSRKIDCILPKSKTYTLNKLVYHDKLQSNNYGYLVVHATRF